jgi:hypothetical protein
MASCNVLLLKPLLPYYKHADFYTRLMALVSVVFASLLNRMPPYWYYQYNESLTYKTQFASVGVTFHYVSRKCVNSSVIVGYR